MRFHRKSTEAATEDREHEERNKKASTRASAQGRKYAQRGSGGALPQQFVEEVKPDGEKVMRTLWRAAFNLFTGHKSTKTADALKKAREHKLRIKFGKDYITGSGEAKAEAVGVVNLK